ncbi:MAG: hypothetical protein ACR2FO_06585 [Actinomycetota bacterium]
MRRREPGFYVSVMTSAGSLGAPVELLDGPWPNKQSAEHRAGEIASARPLEDSIPPVVEIINDGLTVLRPPAEDHQP